MSDKSSTRQPDKAPPEPKKTSGTPNTGRGQNDSMGNDLGRDNQNTSATRRPAQSGR